MIFFRGGVFRAAVEKCGGVWYTDHKSIISGPAGRRKEAEAMTERELVALALAARERAYAPYSHFKVGAALLCGGDAVYTGCNIENASYPCTLCAERVAAGKAVSEGRRDFTLLAVAGSAPEYCTPCGLCRQFLYEFAPDLRVLCADSAGQVLQTLRSRCVELMTRPAETAETAPAAGAEEGAALLLEALLERRRGAAAEAAVELERRKLSREDLAAVLERCRAVLSSALLLLYGGQIPEEDRKTALSAAKTLTKAQIMGTIELLQKYRGDCAYNVGAGHVLGALAVELEGIL